MMKMMMMMMIDAGSTFLGVLAMRAKIY